MKIDNRWNPKQTVSDSLKINNISTIIVDDDKYPVFVTKRDLLACTQTVSDSPKMDNIYIHWLPMTEAWCL